LSTGGLNFGRQVFILLRTLYVKGALRPNGLDIGHPYIILCTVWSSPYAKSPHNG